MLGKLAVGDEAFQHKCVGKIQEFKARGKTIVLVSHDLGSIERLCDEAVWLDYERPGFAMSRRIAGLLETAPTARAVLLERHGLVTWGATSEECYRATIEFVTRAADALAPGYHALDATLNIVEPEVRFDKTALLVNGPSTVASVSESTIFPAGSPTWSWSVVAGASLVDHSTPGTLRPLTTAGQVTLRATVNSGSCSQ